MNLNWKIVEKKYKGHIIKIKMAALKNEKMNKSKTLKTESKTYQVANKMMWVCVLCER